jgi:hypothetical protein
MRGADGYASRCPTCGAPFVAFTYTLRDGVSRSIVPPVAAYATFVRCSRGHEFRAREYRFTRERGREFAGLSATR